MLPSDAELVARVLSGDDRVAFTALVRRHQGKVRGLLRKLTGGDAARSDDLAQETFLRAYRGLGGFSGKAQLSTWLCQIAYHAFVSSRPAGAEGAVVALDPDDAPAPLDAHARPLLRLDVERALGQLPRAEREAIALTFGQDMTHEDAARIVGCPLGTLKTNVARGLARLERRLGVWDDGPVKEASAR